MSHCDILSRIQAPPSLSNLRSSDGPLGVEDVVLLLGHFVFGSLHGSTGIVKLSLPQPRFRLLLENSRIIGRQPRLVSSIVW